VYIITSKDENDDDDDNGSSWGTDVISLQDNTITE